MDGDPGHQTRLGKIGGRHDHVSESRFGEPEERGQAASQSAQRSIERQSGTHQNGCFWAGFENFMGFKECQGNGQIEAGSQLFFIGGVQVDGGATRCEFKTTCGQSHVGSIRGLAYRGPGKTQKLGARQAAGQFHLDPDQTRRHSGQQ